MSFYIVPDVTCNSSGIYAALKGGFLFLSKRTFVLTSGHPLEGHATWSDGTTWPLNLGAEAAKVISKN